MGLVAKQNSDFWFFDTDPAVGWLRADIASDRRKAEPHIFKQKGGVPILHTKKDPDILGGRSNITNLMSICKKIRQPVESEVSAHL